jgi:hypothetical protein
MTLRTEEVAVIWRRKLWIAVCGGIILEEALNLSSDRLLNYDDDDKVSFSYRFNRHQIWVHVFWFSMVPTNIKLKRHCWMSIPSKHVPVKVITKVYLPKCTVKWVKSLNRHWKASASNVSREESYSVWGIRSLSQPLQDNISIGAEIWTQ